MRKLIQARDYLEGGALPRWTEGEEELAKMSVSARQFERWYGGKLRTLPHPDACRILEHMFGYAVQQLLAPADPPSQETSLILGQDDPRPATARTLAQGVIWAPGALIPGDLGMTENSAPFDPERETCHGSTPGNALQHHRRFQQHQR